MPVVSAVVSSEQAIIKHSVFAEVARPAKGKPVQLVNVPDVGVPRIGVTRVGLVLKTSRLVPVSSETNVATSADVEDVIPVIGSPVQLVKVPLLGVPRTGVVKVGEVRVLFVNVSVVSVPTSVVVALGKEIVLSAVGSTVVSVVSKLSAVAPSNIT